MKLTTLEERFLASFFSYDVLIGDFVSESEREALFMSLSKIFMLPEQSARELYPIASAKQIREIDSRTNYELHKRLQAYKKLQGRAQEKTDYSFIADIKGRALTSLIEKGYSPVLDATKPATFSYLANSAQCGSISSLRITGTLQILGIFLQKNGEAGMRNIIKTAKWNDPDGILTALCFNESERRTNMERLYTVTLDTPFSSILDAAKEAYGIKNLKKSRESSIIKRAFGLGIIKDDTYAPQFARIVYSPILKETDKVRLILNNQSLVSETNDLPLSLKALPLIPQKEAEDGSILCRRAELDKIIGSIVYASETNALSPCIVTNDDFAARDYINSIKRVFSDANVVEIDVGKLLDKDLSLDKNHILVRNVIEDQKNIFIFIMRGHASAAVIDYLKGFLKDTDRSCFRLSMPSISLDLRSVLPVCVCDSTCIKAVRHLCDCIDVPKVRAEEMPDMIERLIDAVALEYGVEDMQIEPEAKSLLIKKYSSFSDIELALDKIIYSFKGVKTKTLITLSHVEEFSGASDTVASKLGF